MRLRPLKLKDADLMLEWMLDKEINQFFRFNFDKITPDDVKSFISNSLISENNKHYAIVDDNDIYQGTVSLKNIDMINLNAEYAIVLRKCALGTGIAQFATIEILNKAFSQFKLNKVYLNVLTENVRAIKFYEKIGFIFEGEFKDHLFINGSFHNIKWYAKMR